MIFLLYLNFNQEVVDTDTNCIKEAEGRVYRI